MISYSENVSLTPEVISSDAYFPLEMLFCGRIFRPLELSMNWAFSITHLQFSPCGS